MNYNTSNGFKLKFKTSPNQKILEELNKKGVTVYDKMGNAVNSPVTAVKKTENAVNNTNLTPSVQGASKPTGISSLHDKIGDTIASSKKLVKEQIENSPYKDILPTPKKENTAEPRKSTTETLKITTEPKKSNGYQIKDSVIGLLNNRKNNPWSKSLYDNVDAYAIEKNIPAAQEAIDLNIKTGKLSEADLDKYPYLRDGLAFSYAAGEVGNKKAEKAARELAYEKVDLKGIRPENWTDTNNSLFNIKKSSDKSEKTRYVSENSVRFRSAPGLNSSIIDSMNKGTSVKYTGNKTDKIDGYQWAEVEYDGKKGWVAADYLKINKPGSDVKYEVSPSTKTPIDVVSPSTFKFNSTDIINMQDSFKECKPFDGGTPGDFDGAWGLQCVDFTNWFINTYTNLERTAGNGCDKVNRIAALRSDLHTSTIPTAPSVFSVAPNKPGPGIRNLSDPKAGHTGVVLDVKIVNIPQGSTDPTEYTYEITFIHTYSGCSNNGYNSSVGTKRLIPNQDITYVNIGTYIK